MATKRTKKEAPAEVVEAVASQPAAALKPADLANFLGLKDYNEEQMRQLLRASTLTAFQFIGQEVEPEKQGHLFNQGVKHLAAKFYAAGTSDLEGENDIPAVCRYFFVLVRRELSGSAE